jgi:Na+-driven multidrug efflux pump
MRKIMTYWILMAVLLILFLLHDKLGMMGILLGYFVGLLVAITNPPKNDP